MINKEKLNDHFSERVSQPFLPECFDLFFNTTGYASLYTSYPEHKFLKLYLPDKRGRIYVFGKYLNFNTILFKTVYDSVILNKNQYIFNLGKTSNINNLYALTFEEFKNYKSGKIKVTKNANTGQTKIIEKFRLVDLKF